MDREEEDADREEEDINREEEDMDREEEAADRAEEDREEEDIDREEHDHHRLRAGHFILKKIVTCPAMVLSPQEQAWCDRALAFVNENPGQPIDASMIGARVPRDGLRKVTRMLQEDQRFVSVNGWWRAREQPAAPDKTRERRNQLARERRAKIREANRPPPPFKPARTDFCAPEAAWQAVLCNETVFCRVLVQWKWLSVLPRVCRSFSDALGPLRTRWMGIMCSQDERRAIWKSKANELFGLSAAELERLPFTEVQSFSQKWRYTHLMDRARVLEAACARNGPLFTDIAAAFDRRKKRKQTRKRPRRTCVDFWSEESDSDY